MQIWESTKKDQKGCIRCVILPILSRESKVDCNKIYISPGSTQEDLPKLMQKRGEVEWISVITQTKTFHDLLQMVRGNRKTKRRRRNKIQTKNGRRILEKTVELKKNSFLIIIIKKIL